MSLVVSGMLNKQIAAELGASETTVKIHRGHVMQKMQADSLPELVRMADRLKVSRTAAVRLRARQSHNDPPSRALLKSYCAIRKCDCFPWTVALWWWHEQRPGQRVHRNRR